LICIPTVNCLTLMRLSMKSKILLSERD